MCNIVIWFGLIGILILLAMSIYTYKTAKNAELKLAKYEINTRSTIDSSIPAILDLIIDDCFTDYQVMILIPKNELYISDQREKEIRNDLVCKVVERLSDEAIEKISQFYNVKNIDKIIGDKIYITVMNYVVNHNKMITAQEKINKE